MHINILNNFQPYTNVTVTSDEEETAKKQKEQTFTNSLSSKLTELSENNQNDSKIETLDKTLQQQQVTKNVK